MKTLPLRALMAATIIASSVAVTAPAEAAATNGPWYETRTDVDPNGWRSDIYAATTVSWRPVARGIAVPTIRLRLADQNCDLPPFTFARIRVSVTSSGGSARAVNLRTRHVNACSTRYQLPRMRVAGSRATVNIWFTIQRPFTHDGDFYTRTVVRRNGTTD